LNPAVPDRTSRHLSIDKTEFAAKFDWQPFYVGNDLADHPPHAPHWVRTDSDISVSLSVTLRT